MDPLALGHPMAAPRRRTSLDSPIRSRTTSRSTTVASSSGLGDKNPTGNKANIPTERQGGMSPPKPRLLFLRLPLRDDIKTLFLLALSVITLPLSYILAIILTSAPSSWISYLLPFSPTTPTSAEAHRALCRAEPNFKRHTILVTGVGMTKGLTLARAFHLCGHRVVAAEFEAELYSAWTPWRGGGNRWSFSRAFDVVYSLKKPVLTAGMDEDQRSEVRGVYVRDIRKIVVDEDVDLWVSCSGVASAVEDALVQEALASLGAGAGENLKQRASIQFDVPTTELLHEKSSFIRHAKSLGLPVPETHDVSSHDDVLQALAKATRASPERRFILKPVGMDDANRGNMTLLPLPTLSETEAYVQKLPISKEWPWILQQFVHGNREYCTHSLVVDGEIKVFVACPSSELLMHYRALPPDDPRSRDMFGFTKRFADAEKRDGRNFTGHLSFDFMAEEDGSTEARLYAIECNPRAHTAVALFATPGADMRAMVGAYLSAVDVSPSSGWLPKLARTAPKYSLAGVVTPPLGTTPRYWVGHDLVAACLLPLWGLLTLKLSMAEFAEHLRKFCEHVFSWQDGTFELWDPWPFVGLYHHYWPRTILEAWLNGERWSRLNVSTTKMFAC